MKIFALLFTTAVWSVSWFYNFGACATPADSGAAPEFPSHETRRWINSVPLKMTGNGEMGLRGKVVLLNVWTFM
jgi:hypothetical protein